MRLYFNPGQQTDLTYKTLIDFVGSSQSQLTADSSTAVYLLRLIKSICAGLNFTPSSHQTAELIESSVSDFSELKSLVINSQSKIVLLTSGTTGQPKVVSHPISNLLRDIKISNNLTNNVWGLAYNPTHMAGIQVIFQALLNHNPLIDLYHSAVHEKVHLIKKFKITHLSATPTFFRNLTSVREVFESVERISLGGEKSSAELLSNIRAMFPNAKINNIYASTEAGTLFATQSDSFTIPPSKKHLVKIIDNEIVLHTSLLGHAEQLDGAEWYKTGDLIEWADESGLAFRIASRKNELLNIGGNKVNPFEIESVIESVAGVIQAHVYGKNNSVIGTLLCCDLVADSKLTETSLKNLLRHRLADYQIPRRMYFKSEIATNTNGKKSRSQP